MKAMLCGTTATGTRHRFFCALACGLTMLLPLSALATSVGFAGHFPGKVLLTIDGGSPRIVPIGGSVGDSVKVISADGETATLEIDGKRRVLRVGQNVAEQASGSGPANVLLTADHLGHFRTTGSVNGKPVQFLVDTGASMVAFGRSDAQRLGLDPGKGEVGHSRTANGLVQVSLVKLNTLKIGEVTLNNVDATLLPHDLPLALLGMSFLNRMEIQVDGNRMTLKKKY